MFARTAFPDQGDQTVFVITWPYIDKSHVKAVLNPGGAAIALGTATFAYDKDTGDTTITLAAAPGVATDDPVFYRETPIPADLDDFIKQTKDTKHGSSLAMGLQPINLELVYILQELADLNELQGIDAGAAFEVAATLDFASVAAAGQQELTVTVPGAAVGDPVAVGPPAGIEAGIVITARVSAADTVTVRASNITAGAIDPASASYTVKVFK